jgi:hypothetical protein
MGTYITHHSYSRQAILKRGGSGGPRNPRMKPEQARRFLFAGIGEQSEAQSG